MSLNADAVSEFLVTPLTPAYMTFTSPSQNVIDQQIQGLFVPDLTPSLVVIRHSHEAVPH